MRKASVRGLSFLLAVMFMECYSRNLKPEPGT